MGVAGRQAYWEEGGGGRLPRPLLANKNFGENLWLENTLARARMFWFVFFSCKTQRLKFVVVELGKFFLSHNNLTENLVCYLVVFLASFLVSRLFMFIVENWRKTPNWWFFIVRRVLLWVLLRHQCHRDLRRQVRPHPLQRHLQLQRLQPQPQP